MEVTQDLLEYIVAIVTATRRDSQIQVSASPRGGLALVQLARGQALLNGRDYVIPDDIKQVTVPALAHRVTLRPELWVRQVSADDVMKKNLVRGPDAEDRSPAGRHPLMPAAETETRLRWRLSRHARRLLTLGLAGILIATLSRRPEFAGAAAPALLLLAAGRGTRPPAVSVSARPSADRVFDDALSQRDGR